MTVQNYYTLFLPDSSWSGTGKSWGQVIQFTVQSYTFSYRFSTTIIHYPQLSWLLLHYQADICFFVFLFLQLCQDFYQIANPYQTSIFKPTIFKGCYCHRTKLFILQIHNKSSVTHLFFDTQTPVNFCVSPSIASNSKCSKY